MPHAKPADSFVSKIKGHFTKGNGFGEDTILAIYEARGTKASLKPVREAIASLKCRCRCG